jgi:hypothetical protein
LWRDHRVKPCEAASYELRHPSAGPLTITQHNLVVARSPQQSLCVMTSAAEASSADAMQLLARSAREQQHRELPANQVFPILRR